MRKFYARYIVITLIFFLVVSVLKRWFDTHHLSLWLGALLGSILPDVDSLLYSFYTKPQELSSLRIKKYFSEKNYAQAFDMIYKSRSERTNLLFHTLLFQIIFIVFSFYVITSSGSYFGVGLVLSFLIHLALDQYYDFKTSKNLDSWTGNLNINLDEKQARNYLYTMFAILVLLGLVV